jgi:PAT family beta-lactamase induction signal transducer AmpG
VFGFLQVFSNLGYYALARLGGPNVPLLYAAAGFELFTSGLGTGAFSVLLLRLTQKRFSATQYALFTSLFALPRVLAAPISGFAVDALGWPTFYLATMVLAIPGLVMLSRFVPLGVREPEFTVDEVVGTRAPISAGALAARGVAGGLAVASASVVIVALMDALGAMRQTPDSGFDFAAALWRATHPTTLTDWVQVVGIVAVAAIGGLFVAAIAAARHRSGQITVDPELQRSHSG